MRISNVDSFTFLLSSLCWIAPLGSDQWEFSYLILHNIFPVSYWLFSLFKQYSDYSDWLFFRYFSRYQNKDLIYLDIQISKVFRNTVN